MVTWREEQGSAEDEQDSVHIVWQERNGPPVQAPSKNGFGTNVMKFSIERGLGGRIATSFDPSGVRHEVSLPKPDATDTGEGQPGLDAEPRNGADG